MIGRGRDILGAVRAAFFLRGPGGGDLPGRPLVWLVLVLLIVFLGGCVRSSTMKKALAEAEAAEAQAAEAEKANKANLEEIATLKKDLKELRRRNEALVARDLGRAEHVASLEADLRKTRKENEALWKEVEKLRIATRSGAPKTVLRAGVTSAYLELYRTLREDIEMGTVSIMRSDGTLTIFLSDKSLFDAGKSTLLPEGKALLQRIISAQGPLRKQSRGIKVRPFMSCEKGKDGKKTGSLTERRAAVVTRFLNEKTEMEKDAGRGLPYEEAPALPLPGHIGLVFPVSR